MKNLSLISILALIPSVAYAANLPSYPVGPFNFNQVPVSKALTQIFDGTGINVSPLGVPASKVSASGVSGPLDQVVDKLAASAGLQYSFDGRTIYVKKSNGQPTQVRDVSSALAPVIVPQRQEVSMEEAALRAAPAETAEKEITSWDLTSKDVDMKTALSRWAKQAKWTLVWEAPVNFPIISGTRFNGSFESAIDGVVNALKDSDTPIRAKFYDGNRVLRIIPNNGDK